MNIFADIIAHTASGIIDYALPQQQYTSCTLEQKSSMNWYLWKERRRLLRRRNGLRV